jgi:hypothetical protein
MPRVAKRRRKDGTDTSGADDTKFHDPVLVRGVPVSRQYATLNYTPPRGLCEI